MRSDVAVVSAYSLKSLLSGFSFVYQRADVSGRPITCWSSGAVRTLLRVKADDFRCQVKQIIADFKAAERVADDIPVGIVGVTLPLWTAVSEIQCGLRHVGIVLISLQVEQVAVEVIAYVPLRPAAVRRGG